VSGGIVLQPFYFQSSNACQVFADFARTESGITRRGDFAFAFVRFMLYIWLPSVAK